jgi:predicted nucleic acid-binding protein
VLIAVDTNVLLDHAIGKEKIPDCLDVLRQRLKVDEFLVTPTVLQELAYQADCGGTKEEKDVARGALTSMLGWGYQPINLVPVGHGVVEQIGLKLRMQGIIPQEEQNDSFIVAEAALLGCGMLLSSDHDLLDAQENGKLNRVLKECDVNQLTIASPSTIVSQFSLRH